MAKIVVIGCKLPHGLVLEHPMDPNQKVVLNGKNKALIIGADYATTEVDADFMEQWVAVNKEFPAVKSGAIFVAKSVADVAAVARENADRKTGFEAMDPKSHGVKPADKD
ncbi:MAG: hypothetical protein WC107_07635 [Patescibacteria group bacterium]|jgi:hypothetical protein